MGRLVWCWGGYFSSAFFKTYPGMLLINAGFSINSSKDRFAVLAVIRNLHWLIAHDQKPVDSYHALKQTNGSGSGYGFDICQNNIRA